MNKIDALKATRDQIARGEWKPGTDFPSDETGLRRYAGFIDSAMVRGSLDEMRAMHLFLLPGYTWRLEAYDGHAYCAIQHPNSDREFVSCAQPTPARAWLGAILGALIDREEEAERKQATKELWNG